MGFDKLRGFLASRGLAYVYALFIAGYFLLPMAAGHRRLYYILVLPAALLLTGELARFYRGNVLAGLVLAYAGWMMATLAWTADFSVAGAASTLLYTVSLLSFVAASGYLWVTHPAWRDTWLPRAVMLAALAALVSTVAWYLENPFPTSRLQPLGVMHHENKAGCAYGLFLVFAMHYLSGARDWPGRWRFGAAAVLLLALVLLTQSRTALAAVSVGLVALLGLRALAVVGAGAALSWLLLAANPASWNHRVESFSFRPGIWEQVLAEMQGFWLTGRGYLLDPHVQAYGSEFNHAHNSYLATLRDGGIVGLLLLVAMLATALLWAWRHCRATGERLYIALLLYGMTSIFMDFDRLFVHPKELWLFFWLPLALAMTLQAVPRGRGAPAQAPA